MRDTHSPLSRNSGTDRCTCRPALEQATRDDVFIWRGDPTWWSCMSCDKRVRQLTYLELMGRRSRPKPRLTREPALIITASTPWRCLICWQPFDEPFTPHACANPDPPHDEPT